MNLDPLTVALAGLITTIQTAILMYAAYHWPTGRNDVDDHKHTKHDEGDEES